MSKFPINQSFTSIRKASSFAFFVMWMLIANFDAVLAFIPSSKEVSSSSVSLAGSNRTHVLDGMSVLSNPASMSLSDKTVFSASYLGGFEKFDTISNVVISNVYIGGSSTQTGSFSPESPNLNQVSLGGHFEILGGYRQARLGWALRLQPDVIFAPSSKDIAIPEYGIISSSHRKTQGVFGVSFLGFSYLYFGVGGYLYLVGDGLVSTILPSKSDPATSSQSIQMDLRPGLALHLGTLLKIDEQNHIGLTFTDEQLWSFDVQELAQIKIAFSGTPLDLFGSSSMFYEPRVYSLSYGYKGIRNQIYLTLDFEDWSNYDGGLVRLQFNTLTGTFEQFSETITFGSIWVPRVGYTRSIFGLDVSLGYSYRPSPLESGPGRVNFLDTDRHIFGGGISKKMIPFWSDKEWKIELHLQYQNLVQQIVTKVDPTEVGAPQINMGGNIFGYGLTLTTGI